MSAWGHKQTLGELVSDVRFGAVSGRRTSHLGISGRLCLLPGGKRMLTFGDLASDSRLGVSSGHPDSPRVCSFGLIPADKAVPHVLPRHSRLLARCGVALGQRPPRGRSEICSIVRREAGSSHISSKRLFSSSMKSQSAASSRCGAYHVPRPGQRIPTCSPPGSRNVGTRRPLWSGNRTFEAQAWKFSSPMSASER